MSEERTRPHLAILSPLVLTADLILLLGREVVLDIERLANLLRRLALDHVGDGLAADVQQGLDVHVVGREDDLEEHLLVHLHELLVPLFDVRRLLAAVGVVVSRRLRVVLVVFAPVEHLLEDLVGDLGRVRQWVGAGAVGVRDGTYVHDWDRLCAWVSQILDHVLDQHGALGHLTACDGVSMAVEGCGWWRVSLTAAALDAVGAEQLDGLLFLGHGDG